MAELFHGIGDPWVKTTNLTSGTIGEEVILPLELFEFEFNSEVESLEAQSMGRNGVQKTIASAPGAETSTLVLRTQLGRWDHLGFFLNQFQQQVASINIPILKIGTVPATADYEIGDAGITAGTAAGVYVHVYDGANSGYRTKAATPASPSAGEVGVDGTNNKLVFHSSDAGKTVAYTLPVAQTNVGYYGGTRAASADSYGTIEFWGTLFGTEDRIYFPSLDFSTRPSLNFAGDVATLEVEFSANTPSGADFPYTIYNAADLA